MTEEVYRLYFKLFIFGMLRIYLFIYNAFKNICKEYGVTGRSKQTWVIRI